MNDELIAAPERAAAVVDATLDHSRSAHPQLRRDAALIRALIERERNGGERAQIVAYLEDYDPQLANAIEAGAHLKEGE